MKINKNSNTESPSANSVDELALSSIINLVSDKHVLYIATTFLDYLRIQQEITILNAHAKHVYIIVSSHKYYIVRLIYVYLKSLFFFKKFDVIFIGFAPQLILPLLKWRFLGKKIIIDFFISLYDTMIMDRKKFSEKSWVAKILKFLDKLTLKRADLIISDTLAHAAYFVEDLGCDINKIQTLYLNADNKYYYPKIVKKPQSLKNKYVVLFFGSVRPLQGTDLILNAINLSKDENIFFVMIGPLDYSKCINKNVKFIKWLSQEKLSDYIAFADLCLAGHFCANLDKAHRTIPGKAYIYEAMNKKIVLGDNSANRERYPQQYQSIKFVKMGSSLNLINVIMESYWEDRNDP